MYWYEDEVKRLEKESLRIGYKADTIFYGSSSMRLWASLNDDFKDINPVNLGFGGSTLAACVWFFDRVMQNYSPKRLVIYAGDNDMGDGRHPEEVFIFFKELVIEVEKRFGNLPCYFISLKPSIARQNIIDQFKYTNNLIENEIIKNDNNWKFINIFKEMIDQTGRPKKEYFLADNLHLSESGYRLWKDIISKYMNVNS